METEEKKRFQAWGMLFFLALTWGSSYLLMKKALFSPSGEEVFLPGQVAALRITLTSFMLAPFALRRIRLLSQRKYLLPLMAVGVIGNTIPAFLFPFAQQHIDSALAGILNSMVPLTTLVLAILFFKLKTRWNQVIGILVGLSGAVGMIIYGGTVSFDGTYPYGFLVLAATICYGINANVLRNFLSEVHPITVTSLAFIFLGIPALIYLLSTDFTVRLVELDHGWASFGYVAILAVVGTALAKIIFTRLVSKTSALFASSVTYLIPLVASFWGILDGETLGFEHLVFGGIILVGVYLVNRY